MASICWWTSLDIPDKHRMGLFARKPAPLQITWLGYFGTTGLTQIDYLLAGPWDVPVRGVGIFRDHLAPTPHASLLLASPSGGPRRTHARPDRRTSYLWQLQQYS